MLLGCTIDKNVDVGRSEKENEDDRNKSFDVMSG